MIRVNEKIAPERCHVQEVNLVTYMKSFLRGEMRNYFPGDLAASKDESLRYNSSIHKCNST